MNESTLAAIAIKIKREIKEASSNYQEAVTSEENSGEVADSIERAYAEGYLNALEDILAIVEDK